HRNISIGEVPPWCVNTKEDTRTRNAACRNLCGFLNTGLGGTIYIGILDKGVVQGVRLTQYQLDHLLLSLRDSLDNFSPPVPRFMYHTQIVPVLEAGDPYPTEFLPCPEWVRAEPHYLRSHMLCWCDYDSLGQFHNGILPMSFVVEITVLPVDKEDPCIKALMPGLKIPTLPVFQCEDGQVYFRKHSSIVKYSMTDIMEQAKEEVAIYYMPQLMGAWKRWKMISSLLELVKKMFPQQEKVIDEIFSNSKGEAVPESSISD
ncbi:hypothetical protein L9F63_013281, partial [Diploptera punctata]